MQEENRIGSIVVDLIIKVHRELGPGLLESAYEKCLAYELRKAGLKVEEQKVLPLVYEEITVEEAYRLDLLVEEKVIVEIKSIKRFEDVHMAQLLTYLRLSGCRLGYLINFNSALAKNGLKRVVL